MMGDSVAPSAPPRSPSPAPGNQMVLGGMPTSNGCGLILAVKQSYAALGGAYQGLHIEHVSGCQNESLFFTSKVLAIVLTLTSAPSTLSKLFALV